MTTKSWNLINNMGKFFRVEIKKIADSNGLKIKLGGLVAIPSFSIEGDDRNIYKTFITQEMLKSGFIINNSVYLSISHNKKILKKFFKVLNIIFKKIKILKNEKNILKQLDGRVSVKGFKRLN